jgi:hypothetical protein
MEDLYPSKRGINRLNLGRPFLSNFNVCRTVLGWLLGIFRASSIFSLVFPHLIIFTAGFISPFEAYQELSWYYCLIFRPSWSEFEARPVTPSCEYLISWSFPSRLYPAIAFCPACQFDKVSIHSVCECDVFDAGCPRWNVKSSIMVCDRHRESQDIDFFTAFRSVRRSKGSRRCDNPPNPDPVKAMTEVFSY